MVSHRKPDNQSVEGNPRKDQDCKYCRWWKYGHEKIGAFSQLCKHSVNFVCIFCWFKCDVGCDLLVKCCGSQHLLSWLLPVVPLILEIQKWVIVVWIEIPIFIWWIYFCFVFELFCGNIEYRHVSDVWVALNVT